MEVIIRPVIGAAGVSEESVGPAGFTNCGSAAML